MRITSNLVGGIDRRRVREGSVAGAKSQSPRLS